MMGATVTTFPVARRDVPMSTRAQVNRAAARGVAHDLCAILRKRMKARREQERTEELERCGVFKSPTLLVLTELLRTLPEHHRRELRQRMEEAEKALPNEPMLGGAMWLLTGLTPSEREAIL